MSIKELPHHHGDQHELKLLRDSFTDNQDNFANVSELFKQLSDISRIRIFWLLCHHEDCVLNIASLVGMSSPAVSHHLKSLRDCNLIISRRVGKEVYYKAATSEAASLLHEMIESLIDITCPEHNHEDCCCCAHDAAAASDSAFPADQIEIIHDIHDYLSHHLDQRITIESLSHIFPMNPTTIKTVFKSVYGNSIAAHIKEHRMEQAARLLSETDSSIAEVASAVGYGSQSKFSTAFKEVYGCLPTEYRRGHNHTA